MQLRRNQVKITHGDTLIEVILALSIFATLAVMAIHTMNSGMYQAERAVEITMARNEIDAQAEAIRFIQNNYVAEREYPAAKQQYSALWREITAGKSIPASEFKSELYDINNENVHTCDDAYRLQVPRNGAVANKVFAINTRLLEPSSAISATVGQYTYRKLVDGEILISGNTKHSGEYVLRPASLYPRGIFSVLDFGEIRDNALSAGTTGTDTDSSLVENKIYRRADAIEGIWVIAVQGDSSGITRADHHAEFYDFYIRSCWQATGSSAPSTLTTIVRLYNPEVIE
ncbi:hypothetical protein IIY67_01710 [Candidatus Saccharibacteria bacterium]|nr:hypothetical protein [Candidatus Saccharibacteria bacterium]